MRLALASQPVRNGDVAWNVRCMEDVLRACSGRADTVVFGESVLRLSRIADFSRKVGRESIDIYGPAVYHTGTGKASAVKC